MVNVAEQVNKDVAECLQQHGFSKLDEERINLLTGQIIDVAGVEHPVYKLLRKFTLNLLALNFYPSPPLIVTVRHILVGLLTTLYWSNIYISQNICKSYKLSFYTLPFSDKRILGFVYQLISTAQPQKIQFPPGVSTVAEELNAVCGQFLRLTSHNRSVFGAHYANIIRALLQRTEDVEVSA